jgi:hypothetical protein
MAQSTCIPIEGLVFDQKSLDAIKKIKEFRIRTQLATTLLGGNIILSLFAGKGLPASTDKVWTITQTDWKGYADGMASIPKYYQSEVKKFAELMWYDYATGSGGSHTGQNRKLEQFWQGVADGCQ